MNICRDCKFHQVNPDGNHLLPGEWYDQWCSHPMGRREKTIDPVTGKLVYDIGGYGFGNEAFPFCRDINPEGKCELYERKESE